MFISTLQTTSDGSMGAIGMLVWLAICITVIAGIWRVFTKAGEPGWGVLIPIYNFYLLCRIAQRPGWWLILMFIPIVNLAVGIVLSIDIARHFGKGAGFGVGLAFLGMVLLVTASARAQEATNGAALENTRADRARTSTSRVSLSASTPTS